MQSYQNMSDEELIAALRSGEKEITDYLMDKYKSLVKKKAKALYLIGGETDDLIQEGMIGLLKLSGIISRIKTAAFFISQTFVLQGRCIQRWRLPIGKSMHRSIRMYHFMQIVRIRKAGIWRMC